MSRSTAEEIKRGFVTVSAGNHGQAVAWCAKRLGAPCTVYVPEDAVERKIESMESMGAKIVKRPHKEIMESMNDNRLEELGMTFIHPFGDPFVIAGQGTIGLEILEDLPAVRTVVIPVGGGGLSNGIAFALRSLKPEVKIYGVEAENSAPLPESLRTGKAQRVPQSSTIADGIATMRIYEYMLPLFLENGIDALTVTDTEMKNAMKHLMKESHAIAEAAGASSLAAAYKFRDKMEGPIVCVVSGGNASPQLLAEILVS